MAAGNFKAGCFTYVTLGDVKQLLFREGHDLRHPGMPELDTVIAKIIWTEEACRALHKSSGVVTSEGTSTGSGNVSGTKTGTGNSTSPLWPKVEQPPGTGVLDGEVMIPAGSEDMDLESTDGLSFD